MFQTLKRIVKNSVLFKGYCEFLLRKNEIRRFIDEADEYLNQHDISEKEVVRTRYISDLKKYMFSFDEWYFQYDLSTADSATKSTFISRSRAQRWYRKLVRPEIRNIFHEKPRFLNTFSGYIYRKYLICDECTTLSQLRDILNSDSVIVKPQSGSLGQGVYKLTRNNISQLSLPDFLNKCRAERCLIEECIKGSAALQSFHPQSLNTIRIMTASLGDSTFIFGSFIRFGRGNAVIDNAHGGGIYCSVDISNGSICSDAYDTAGNTYVAHPDTGLKFKGFVIPKWKEIVLNCCDAHKKIDIPFVGWDVCINDKDQIEFIEGNHAPDMDIIQGPMKKGYMNEFTEVCTKYSRQ